jgi:mannosyltransferase OCH1-like enzyme
MDGEDVIIPRFMHRIWIGSPPPDWVHQFGDTWAEHHPEWQHCFWNDDTVQDLLPLSDTSQAMWNAAPVLFPNHVEQFRSDILRYHLLYLYGGVYVDADFYALKPIDELIHDVPFFAVYEVQGKWIANGLMGATKSHPLLVKLIEESVGNVKAMMQQHRRKRPARVSGPEAITKVLNDSQWLSSLEGRFRVLDQRNFFPYGCNEVAKHPMGEDFDDPNLYAVHVWHNQRRERGLL